MRDAATAMVEYAAQLVAPFERKAPTTRELVELALAPITEA